MRGRYTEEVKHSGEELSAAIQTGLEFFFALAESGINGLELEKLSSKLAGISRRVLGPDHELTTRCELFLEKAKKRVITVHEGK